MSLTTAQLFAEIHDIHVLIGDWFGGRTHDRDAARQRLADMLHPDFTLVPPNGVEVDAPTFLEQLDKGYGQRPEVEFYAENIRVLCSAGDFTVVRFHECDKEPNHLGVRVSTAVLQHSSEHAAGFQWLNLQETKITG